MNKWKKGLKTCHIKKVEGVFDFVEKILSVEYISPDSPKIKIDSHSNGELEVLYVFDGKIKNSIIAAHYSGAK